jgi:DNA mismatch repair protein MutS2
LPELEIIGGLAGMLVSGLTLESRIEGCVISENEMADGASAELRRIRRSIGLQNDAVRDRLNRILNSAANKTLLQDSIVTMRQGRYVIPVKQEHKSRFPGIVHDRSATGATLFIEPQDIVNANNELRELELAEAREIERILAELSAEVAEAGQDIINNQRLLVKLDMIFARGRLSVLQRAVPAAVGGEFLRVKNGRHPLIPADKVVPINLSLGKGCNTLVVTGPNTGGKTVTLKTVGLFVLMSQSGLHVPADEGTEIPVFTDVYADIGDEQSIEQSLSTFSSHMNNIVEILRRSGERSLALLDELGAGTDPSEGAALAVAILENLRGRGVKTLATTHYNELKKYALATEGVENASMEFDVETLSPTYRLRTGIPGRSNAFEISRRLGLQASVIGRAAGMMDAGELRFESVICSIEADKKTAERERDEAILLKLKMKRQKEELDRELADLEMKKEKILNKAKAGAKELLQGAKEFAEEIKLELRELPGLDQEKERNRRYEYSRRSLREMDELFRESERDPRNPDPLDALELRAGARVRVAGIDQTGTVIAPPDEKNEVQVRLGRMKLSVHMTRLMKTRENDELKNESRASAYASLQRGKVLSVTPVIDVRGENLNGAVADVDKYLDDAFIAGLSQITIIHGKGEGVLREGLHSMLRVHSHVKRFRKGMCPEGGDGVTVCEIG